jgi:serine/threonine protein kinase
VSDIFSDANQIGSSFMSAEPRRVTDTEEWTQWQGQVVNGAFALRRFLGAATHGAVFLTEYKAKNLADAAIKFVPADASKADAQLAQWSAAAKLSHPHLVRLFEVGRCQLEGRDYLFVVMEHAEQTLAQILRHRALSPDEVREVLLPALDALAFLHRNQLVQGQLKPSNFLAVNDQLKLSSDTIRPAGNAVRGAVRMSSYDPPELKDRGYSTAGDIWGLGMTLVEALTQRTMARPDEPIETISLPPTFPAPLANTVLRCLSLAPAIRPTITELEAQYKPAPPEKPVPATAPPAPAISNPPPQPPPPPQAQKSAPEIKAPPPPPPTAQKAPPETTAPESSPKRDWLLWAIAVALLISLVAWFGSSFFGSSRTPEQPPAVAAPAPAPVAPPTIAKTDAARTSPASRSSKPQPAATSADVLHQVIPDVPRKISNKITGRVLVTVRVLVDPAGNVIGTLMENPGPSKYFARLADKAAGEWKFVPSDNQAARVWLVRFAFSRDGITTRTTAVP